MTDDTSIGSKRRFIPRGPVERSAVRYALLGWLLYHAVKVIDPGWIDVPFVAIAVFAVFGAARGLDRSLLLIERGANR